MRETWQYGVIVSGQDRDPADNKKIFSEIV